MSVEVFVKAAQRGDIGALQRNINRDKAIVNCSLDLRVTLPDGSALLVEGDTALHEAAANGHIVAISFLLKNGANIETKTTAGWTPLHAATFNKQYGAALFLVEHGSDIKACDQHGFTPINGACRQGCGGVIVSLLQNAYDHYRSYKDICHAISIDPVTLSRIIDSDEPALLAQNPVSGEHE